MAQVKILHAADLHVDSPLRGLPEYDGAPTEEVRQATRSTFTRLVDEAVERRVDLVVLAGDLYDGTWKDYNTGLFVVKEFARLHDEGIPVAVAYGNHDAESKITTRLRLPPNVHVFGSAHAESRAYDDIGVVAHGQSYATPRITEDLSSSYPPAVGGMVNVGVLHTCFDGTLGHAPYAPCTVDSLRSRGYDYWALGHVHKRRVVLEDPVVVFPGNLQGRHVGETGPKGATLVVFDDGEPSTELVVLDTVRWEECEVDATGSDLDGCLDRCRDSLAALATGEVDILAVRVSLTGVTDFDRTLRDNHAHLTNEVRALALDVGVAQVWVEKVVVETEPHSDFRPWSGEGVAAEIGRVLADVREKLPELVESREGPFAAIAALRSKLRAAAPAESEELDEEELAKALEDAASILASRLVTEGSPDAN